MEVLDFVNKYWAIIIFSAYLVGTWYVLRTQIKLLEVRVKHIEYNSDERLKQDAATQAKLAVLENMLLNIAKNMEDLKNDVRRLGQHKLDQKDT